MLEELAKGTCRLPPPICQRRVGPDPGGLRCTEMTDMFDDDFASIDYFT